MRFKLCIILIVISVFVFSGIGMAAEFGKTNAPRITIQAPNGPFYIWTFYDTGLEMLCYVSNQGQTISCTPLERLTRKTQDKINSFVEKFHGKHPAIIQIR